MEDELEERRNNWLEGCDNNQSSGKTNEYLWFRAYDRVKTDRNGRLIVCGRKTKQDAIEFRHWGDGQRERRDSTKKSYFEPLVRYDEEKMMFILEMLSLRCSDLLWNILPSPPSMVLSSLLIHSSTHSISGQYPESLTNLLIKDQ